MHTLSESDLAAVSGGAFKIPDPYPIDNPEGDGIQDRFPVFPSYYRSDGSSDYSLRNIS